MNTSNTTKRIVGDIFLYMVCCRVFDYIDDVKNWNSAYRNISFEREVYTNESNLSI